MTSDLGCVTLDICWVKPYYAYGFVAPRGLFSYALYSKANHAIRYVHFPTLRGIVL